MEIISTSIKDLFVFKPTIHEDKRGYFFESFRSEFIENAGINTHFIQENESKSKFGVLRGLHFQKEPFEQAKLVRVLDGEILDVAVDLRKDSKTFGKFESIVLSSSNKKQLLIPRGFAHGFVTLSKTATVSYKVDNYYSKESESGIRYNDKTLQIDWKLDRNLLIISEKDLKLSFFNDL